jgi:hypothetical protein
MKLTKEDVGCVWFDHTNWKWYRWDGRRWREMKIDTEEEKFVKPTIEQVAWVFKQLVENAGTGTFRYLIYHRLGFSEDSPAYCDLWPNGGIIHNTMCDAFPDGYMNYIKKYRKEHR